MTDQQSGQDNRPPKLWEEERDPYHRWIWRAADGTFLAGFKDRDTALAHGEANGWKP